ncbi:hypothetical protein G7B40_039810 [Aetokthonos hydrillicola Thurmond2011]|jgi:hypothetical protein|uniref:Uncharacterized protein n=1 Tax=Aetokthonos hydrillicola Thurmond2011 TaxID=2712845 RepID=A0AAP5IGJ7_9CYAN|nr:hypothetical protein [Aetokthonos hydrillicola]MBW4590132.1 hypothetical protein [Aetokthonos hydrillicola CCALA 1050]MDR9900637.1 hypothetical protein [Aetokthonos hydrillicola Thurmond2011]
MRNCIWFIAFTFASSFTAINVAIGQPQNIQEGDVTPECSTALRTASGRIEKGRRVKVVSITKYDFRQEYSDYPKDRPFSYGFVLDGTATGTVLQSGKFLTAISTEVINNCPNAGMVTFVEHYTDGFVTFGLVGKNSVRAFKCLNPGSKPSWGSTICI